MRASGGDNENIKAAMERHGKISKRFRRTLTATRKIRELSSYREDIDFLIDFLTIRKDKYEAFKRCLSAATSSILRATFRSGTVKNGQGP